MRDLPKEYIDKFWGDRKKVKARVKGFSGLFGLKVIEVVSFTTLGVNDKDGKFYDWYELEFLKDEE